MNELIQQARELCEGATPGPWRYKETADYSEIYDNHSWGKALSPLAMVGSNLDDAAFIAASRFLVPQLCDALEAAEKELIDYHHTQQVADGKTAENARMRKINDQVTAQLADAHEEAAKQHYLAFEMAGKADEAERRERAAVEQRDTLMRRHARQVEVIRRRIDSGTLTTEEKRLLDDLMFETQYDRRGLEQDNLICAGGCVKNYAEPWEHCEGCTFRERS